MSLTIVYMVTENDRLDWLEEMLSKIQHLPYPIVQYAGIIGDVSEARYRAYSSVKTEYVLMLDPDDIMLPEAITCSLEFLKANREVAACCSQEVCINPSGTVRSAYPKGDYSFGRHLHSTLEFHGGVMFRTSLLLEFLPKLREANFYDFDWALKLCIGNKYPVKKLGMTGYYFRRKPNSHHSGILKTPDQIPPIQTGQKLMELGLIKQVTR